ncbi:MAG TPA: hypothetical protein VKU83_06475 [Puia sp.]|nr:hypothetical protein [Puia sp.]
MSLNLEPINELHRKIQEVLKEKHMIQPNELRKGNKVYGGNPARCIATVLTIIQQGIEAEYQTITYGAAPNNPGIGFGKFEDIYPIPLTPEILGKCGFERNEDKDVNGYLAYRSDHFYAFDIFINKDGKVAVHFLKTALSQNHPQYLHQLQNTIFVLTGEELEVKL